MIIFLLFHYWERFYARHKIDSLNFMLHRAVIRCTLFSVDMVLHVSADLVHPVWREYSIIARRRAGRPFRAPVVMGPTVEYYVVAAYSSLT